ncbi:hypothetical protein [Puia sp.]|jgi:hypothetical protein|uniref:hypothetical protein n=1 Tax=Puia sp. TaxID=2045100 RepID=UPI002F3E89FF
MKKILLIIPIGFLACTSVFGQRQHVNTDSLSLISQISANQLKLAKLENTVNQVTREKQDATTTAQMSANSSSAAASNLTNAPADKKLSQDASNQAGDARSDAKKQRQKSAKLDKLNKDINDLKAIISDEQTKLNSYTGVNTPMPGTVQANVAPTDTTRRP